MKVYIDANNKGQMAFMTDTGERDIVSFGYVPETHNQAEYLAVLFVLNRVKPITEILSDSQLVINQLNGLYAIKNAALQELASRVWNNPKTKMIKFTWIPREKNLAGKILG